jgi:fructose-1,6-bisphosphatase/inositol monophosphatase family enzyme
MTATERKMKTPKGREKEATAAETGGGTDREKRSRQGAGVPKKVRAVSKSRYAHVDKRFLIDVAAHIRDAVAPAIRSMKGREVVGTAASGDATFQLDKTAEKALLSFLKNAQLPVAYYSEDAGYTTFTSKPPTTLLVIDPIDGSRAAKSGFEACVVSVASTSVIERPRMADVEKACVMEIVGERTFYAERGRGARIYVDNRPKRPRLSTNTNLELLSWAMSVPARPAEPQRRVLYMQQHLLQFDPASYEPARRLCRFCQPFFARCT